MMREAGKRPRRTPRTSEEVNHFISLRKKRESLALKKLKATWVYKLLNVWNIVSIFIYLEIVFCYFGPCHYQTHYSYQIAAHMGNEHKSGGKTIISDVDVYALDGIVYKLIVNDFIEVPPKLTQLKIGKDYLLHKKLKAVLSTSDKAFRIFSASPILFLSVFLSFIGFIAYYYNLNENIYPLSGLCSLNTLTLLCILCF